VSRIIFSKHVAELVSCSVDAPQLIRAWHELSLGVPALHPSNSVIKAEEANLDRLATRVLDLTIPLACPVVGIQEIAFKDL
jgi:hypothetical protein